MWRRDGGVKARDTSVWFGQRRRPSGGAAYLVVLRKGQPTIAPYPSLHWDCFPRRIDTSMYPSGQQAMAQYRKNSQKRTNSDKQSQKSKCSYTNYNRWSLGYNNHIITKTHTNQRVVYVIACVLPKDGTSRRPLVFVSLFVLIVPFCTQNTSPSLAFLLH